MRNTRTAPTEERTARLTVLIDPRKKAVFETLCAAEDVTPSQVVRRLIRDYIEKQLGQPWAAEVPEPRATPVRRPPRK
ncbi:MAG: CopG family transcriptional regulator [Pseudomonadota bacterium]